MSKLIALIAGEASGDFLGSQLIRSLKHYYPSAYFVGIGGPQMKRQGLNSIKPMESLAVMGLFEVLCYLPNLLKIRSELVKLLLSLKPDVFIGIDSPDFNLPIARRLKQANIRTVHYVSPSVWAWREKRTQNIARSVDLLLTLFPFEADYYKELPLKVAYVGHALADKLPIEKQETKKAKNMYHLSNDTQVLVLAPGSRKMEIKRLLPIFLQAAVLLLRNKPDMHFFIPAATFEGYEQIQKILSLYPEILPRTRVELGGLQPMIQAADAVLIASGTATLEALLLKKPMVVSYKVMTLSACIIKRRLLQPYISLPNVLAGKKIVPELLQREANAEKLAKYCMNALQSDEFKNKVQQVFVDIHHQLKCNSSLNAAQAIDQLLSS